MPETVGLEPRPKPPTTVEPTPTPQPTPVEPTPTPAPRPAPTQPAPVPAEPSTPGGETVFGIPSFGIPALPGMGIPKLSAGRIVAPMAGWQSVRYTDAVFGGNVTYTRPPALLVVAEPRSGWFTSKKFEAPKMSIALPLIDLPPAVQISVPSVTVPSLPEIPPLSIPSATVSAIAIPSVTLPSISISVPTVTLPRTTVSQQEYDGWMQANLWPLRLADDWGPLNFVRDRVRVALSYLMSRLWQASVQPQIDQVRTGAQDAVNAVVSNVQSQVNTALAVSKDRIQAALNAAINDANSRIAGLKDSVNAAVKTVTEGANAKLATFRNSVNDAIRKIPDSVQGALNTYGNNIQVGVNTAFKSNRDKLQAALDSYRVNIQDQVNAGLLQITGYSTQALNSIVPMLWQTLGLPERTLFTPVLFKTRVDGFDWYAPTQGVVLHYAAFGS